MEIKIKLNQELLLFQNENDKYINSFNNFMKQKSSKIEENAENYLNYLSQERIINKMNNSKTINQNGINSYINYPHRIQPKTKISLFRNKSEPDLITLSSRGFNNEVNNFKTLETEKNNFIPGVIKAKGSDITNPFFYDQVAKEIMQKNQEVMDYNRKQSENKYKKKMTSIFSDDKIPLGPEKINNPKYYDLGASSLIKNPILIKNSYTLL